MRATGVQALHAGFRPFFSAHLWEIVNAAGGSFIIAHSPNSLGVLCESSR
jgi:hypothetical protein